MQEKHNHYDRLTCKLRHLGRQDGEEVCPVKVDHSMTYSLGDGKHTNGIESCWAILKRGVYGIYHHVSVKHLQEDVDEFCYRLNHRDVDEALKHLLGLGISA